MSGVNIVKLKSMGKTITTPMWQLTYQEVLALDVGGRPGVKVPTLESMLDVLREGKVCGGGYIYVYLCVVNGAECSLYVYTIVFIHVHSTTVHQGLQTSTHHMQHCHIPLHSPQNNSSPTLWRWRSSPCAQMQAAPALYTCASSTKPVSHRAWMPTHMPTAFPIWIG